MEEKLKAILDKLQDRLIKIMSKSDTCYVLKHTFALISC